MKNNRFLESQEYEEFVKMSDEALVSEHVGSIYIKRAYTGRNRATNRATNRVTNRGQACDSAILNPKLPDRFC